MDWKEVLRRRLATPNIGPNSEFGRGCPRREPGPKLEVEGEWEGQQLGAALSSSVKPRLTKQAESNVVSRSREV